MAATTVVAHLCTMRVGYGPDGERCELPTVQRYRGTCLCEHVLEQWVCEKCVATLPIRCALCYEADGGHHRCAITVERIGG